jgi:hypothetical protein
MKVILSVPDEGYSECTWWRLFWVYLMKVILSVPDEGYSECTWWWLFWVYLMKVILSVPDEGYSRNLISTFLLLSLGRYLCWWTISPWGYHPSSSQCYYHWVDTSAGGPLVPEGIIHPVVSALALTWCIIHIFYRNLQFLNQVIIFKLRFSSLWRRWP